MQRHRIGRGVGLCIKTAGKAAAQRADHRALAPGTGQRLRNPLAAGRLAVSAGDAYGPQPRTGFAVDLAGDDAGMTAQLRDTEVRNFHAAVPRITLHVPQHRAGAVPHRLRNVIPPVAGFAGISNECIARPHRAAIHRHPAYAECAHGLNVGSAGRHTSSRTTGACSGASTVVLPGASGGTASKRKVPAATRLNTGAATAPP